MRTGARRSALAHVIAAIGVLNAATSLAPNSGFVADAAQLNLADERAILEEFYDATGGNEWTEKDGWKSTDVDVCSWLGVTCKESTDTSDGVPTNSITSINLKNNNLRDTIPSSFWTLPSLRIVTIGSNSITSLGMQDVINSPNGIAPLEELYAASNSLTKIDDLGAFAATLKHINFNKNQLNNIPFPDDLFDCVHLKSIYMAFNGIGGSIPTTVGKLSNLEELYLFQNQLVGSLPSEMGELVSCQILGLGNNHFDGTLPTEMNRMVNLRDVSIHHMEQSGDTEGTGTGLTGPLLTFGDLPYLTLLFLDGNSLTGSIPNDFLRHNENTEEPVSIGLSNNQLSGPLPKSLERFSALSIDLVGNTGITSIPTELCSLSGWMGGLVETYGCDAILCPAGTYQPREGRAVRDTATCLPCVGSAILGATVCDVDGDGQPDEGTQGPDSDGGGGNGNPVNHDDNEPKTPIRLLMRFYMLLNGEQWAIQDGWETIKTIIEREMTDQEIIDFGVDYCTGWYGVICDGTGQIIELSLPRNALFGRVPTSIFSLPSLKNFDISNNNVLLSDLTAVGATAPMQSLVLSNIQMNSYDGIEQMKSTLRLLYLDGIRIIPPGSDDIKTSLQLPVQFFELSNLRLLHLQHASFSGSLPTLIGQLQGLELLNMYGNSLTGQLPTELGTLVNLQSLDLSENDFSGTIPSQLYQECTSLASLAIHQSTSDKNLGGRLPAFADLGRLRELNLQDNDFSGSVPNNFLEGIIDKSVSVVVSLGGNRISGGLPASLNDFTRLTIDLKDNFITELPSSYCSNDDWMHGEIGRLAESDNEDNIAPCDIILCPPLKFSEGQGKASSTSKCEDCLSNTLYYGQTTCGGEGDGGNGGGDGNTPVLSERQILDQFFSATAGRYWNATHDNWEQPGVPICQREGVRCLGEPGDEHVDELQFFDFGMQGTIPSSIWQLRHVRTLAFTGNPVDISFEGIEQATNLRVFKCSKCVIRSLQGLGAAAGSKLSELHLAENQLTGQRIPDDIYALTSIKKLFLNANQMIGKLEEESIGGMTALHELHIHDNEIHGTIPTTIGLLENLSKLDLSRNKFHGSLPTEMEQLTFLSKLILAEQQSGAKLTGPLLSFVDNEELTYFDVSGNRLSGPLPSNFLAGVEPTEGIRLDLSSNSFTGGIPAQWSRMESLELDVADNFITDLPASICANVQWNRGQVGLLGGCDAILCPPGTHSIYGRKIALSQDCQPCDGGVEGAPYFGTYECQNPELIKELKHLKHFYEGTQGDNWVTQTNWMSDLPFCTWHGITCDDDGFVAEVKLENNMMEGSDVTSVLRLKRVESIDLKGNDVQLDFTYLPGENNLKFIRLSGTNMQSLNGIARATDLRALHITNNNIREIPNGLFKLTKLEKLFMSFNAIEGPISSRFGELESLREFYAFGNYFTGTIPEALGSLTNLVELVLSSNLLSGEIPNTLSSMPNLEQLSLYDQDGYELITGPLPSFSQTPNLWYLDVSDNDLTGPVPDDFMINSIYRNESLSIFLHNNELTGTVPSNLVKFENLDLNLAGNQIEKIPPELCAIEGWMNGMVKTVGNCSAILCPQGTFSQHGYHTPDDPCLPCTHLELVPYLGQNHCENFSSEGVTLDILYDALGGEFWDDNEGWKTNAPICSWKGVLCQDGDRQDTSGITAINLSENGLEGTLPSEVWTLPTLRRLNVKGNPELLVRLDGLQKAKALEVMNLSEVRLPSMNGISQASNLKILHATGNQLNGEFPEELFQLSDTLESLFLAYNLFNGPIPTRIGELTKLEAFYAFKNDFISTIPTEVGLMTNLKVLVLAENIIYGTVPTELSSMPNLEVLSVFRESKSGPRLTGTLPPLDRLPQLNFLFLHGNEIRGEIPDNFLGGSLDIQEIHLESNYLTGAIPASFDDFQQLFMNLADNQFTDMPNEYCDNEDWMDGAVETYGCNAILCTPGSASVIGRSANASFACSDCPNPALVPYHGSLSCDGLPDDRAILAEFYDDLNGDGWYRSDYWNTDVDICDWYGIACIGGDIVEINLGSNNLKGLPSPTIFDLPRLRILWLYSNPITFSFENIASAKKLEDLRLDNTQVHSVHGIGAGTSLVNVDVSFTSIRGTFPEELLKLENLRTLSMSGNGITKVLPRSFESLRYLISLSLDSNQLTGELPDFSNMHFLSNIALQNNLLSGAIPKRFLDKLNSDYTVRVNLASNQLTGVIPEEISRFDDMKLFVRDNKILGVPLSICEKKEWFEEVEKYGCDAVLCKPGTANRYGRRTKYASCQDCPEARYYGSTLCKSPLSSSATAAWTRMASMRWMIISALVSSAACLM